MVGIGHFFPIGSLAPLPGPVPVTLYEPGEGHAERRSQPRPGGNHTPDAVETRAVKALDEALSREDGNCV